MYNSVPREHLRSLISSMQSCVADVKVWMTQNKLQLNNEINKKNLKIKLIKEALLIDPQNSPDLPLLIVFGESEIQFQSVQNLGVIFNDKLSMK